MSTTDIRGYVETLRSGEPLTEGNLRHLCAVVKALLIEESNVQYVAAPVTIVGDLHGQFFDLLTLFKTGGEGERLLLMGITRHEANPFQSP